MSNNFLDLLSFEKCSKAPLTQKPFCRMVLFFGAVWRDLNSGELNIRAMGLVYSTLLSMVPLLALSFSVLKGFGVHYKIEPLLLQLLSPLGNKSAEITENIIGFVNNVKIGVLGTTGLILLIYTVISLMQKVEGAVNYTWRIPESRTFTDRFVHYFSILLIGPVLMFSALGLSSSVLENAVVVYLTEHYGFAIAFISEQFPKLLIIISFLMVYLLVPNTRVKFLPALGGALVAGILWQLGSWGFTTFVASSTTQTAIYSAFATLMFFMIWLYLSWMIVLLGSTTAYYLQNPSASQLPRITPIASPKLKLALSLAICRHLHARAEQQLPPLTALELANELQVPTHYVNQVLQQLTDHQILLYDAATPPRYAPYVPKEKLTNRVLLDIVMEGNKEQIKAYGALQHANLLLNDIDQFFNHLDAPVITAKQPPETTETVDSAIPLS